MSLKMTFSKALSLALIFGAAYQTPSFAKPNRNPQGLERNTYGFQEMDSQILNSTLKAALVSMRCVIVPDASGSDGVFATEEKHRLRNPKSCHDVGRAIDIHKLDCGPNRTDNAHNLNVLYRILKTAELGSLTSLFLVCHGSVIDRCTKGEHGKHVHFGASQYTGCW